MAKKGKSSQFSTNNDSNRPKQPVPTAPNLTSVQSSPEKTQALTSPNIPLTQTHSKVQPEQMSLDAHTHIQNYLEQANRNSLTKEDLNAVLRLSQHLRVFGLLSVVGYINQANQQNGVVRERTVPVWKYLINQLLDSNNNLSNQALMELVITMSKNNPGEYMINWRKSLQISNHWNFWARAYSEN